MNDMVDEMNEMATDMDSVSIEVQNNADSVSVNEAKSHSYLLSMEGYINYKGDWVSAYNITGYSVGESISYIDGKNYVSKIENNLIEPTSETETAEWNFIDEITLAELELKADKLTTYTKTELDVSLALRALLNGSPTQIFKAKPAEADEDVVNKGQLDEAILNVPTIPVGAVLTCHADTPFEGFLLRAGTEHDRVEYADLWAYAQASGNLYTDAEWYNGQEGSFSTGDGTTTFRIPSGRGLFDRNIDAGAGVDSGRVLGSSQVDELKSHNHNITSMADSTTTYYTGNIQARAVYARPNKAVSSTGGVETRPKNIAVTKCI
ncbi:MAG: tail fiber protein, partial [Sulfurimonas sp.]|nr:tail fiber protein [Sulfurimonas sp.]